MSKLSCNVVRDLMHLYHDEALSAEGRKQVEEHFATCENCRNEYEAICGDMPAPIDETQSTKEKFAKTMTRQKQKSYLRNIVITLAVCAVFFIAALIYVKNTKPVDMTRNEIRYERFLHCNDGKENKLIVLYSAYEYNQLHIDYRFTEDNAILVTANRPAISSQSALMRRDIIVLGLNHVSPADGSIVPDVDRFEFDGQVLWTNDGTSVDEPEYVAMLENPEVNAGYFVDEKEDKITIIDPDGAEHTWTLEGEKIK